MFRFPQPRSPMHFDGTVTLGSLIAAVSFIVMSLFAWRDLDWRMKNIEKWQAKHIVDEESNT